jgi:cell division protein FtsI/penicillin-binding protein 2
VRRRLTIAVLFLGVWALLLVLRLYQLKVVRHDHYRSRADRQQQRVVRSAGLRGRILDVRGRLLAVSVTAESAYAALPEIADPSGTARLIASSLAADPARLAARLRRNAEFTWIARKLEPPAAARLHGLNLSGIYFVPEPKRYYPMREQASQVLGFVGMDDAGLAGLELFYDRTLAGKPTETKLLRDARRELYDTATTLKEPEPGQDLHTTLDASLQYFAERTLEKTVQSTGSRAGAVVLLAPSDGAVLAMASYPGIDGNDPGSYPVQLQRNRITRDLYEPGALFLLVAAAAGAEAGLAPPEAFLKSEDREGVLRRVARSPLLYDQLRDLGFGRPTGVDLPDDRAGFFEPLRGEPGQAVLFPGLAVTPLQMATALTALVNGGLRVHPHFTKDRPAESPVRAFSPRTVASFRSVWIQDAIGGRDRGASYRLAGLAGTDFGPIDGPNNPTAVAAYFGFAPVDRPRLTALVLLEGPRQGGSGTALSASAASPASAAFAEVARDALRYLRVPAEGGASGLWPGQKAGR